MQRGKCRYVDYLSDHLERVDEIPEACTWVMRQGLWLDKGVPDHHNLCDIIAVYSNHVSCIEIALGRSDYELAEQVLENSEMFVERELGYSSIGSKIVECDNLKKRGRRGAASNKHEKYLDNLIERMYLIDEDINDIRWIMRDGIWLQENSKARNKLCDIIAVRYDESVCCIELKGSYDNEGKAKKQLRSSERFVRKSLGYDDITKKVAFYSGGGYDWKQIS